MCFALHITKTELFGFKFKFKSSPSSSSVYVCLKSFPIGLRTINILSLSSLIHSFIHSFIYSFIHLFIHSFIHSLPLSPLTLHICGTRSTDTLFWHVLTRAFRNFKESLEEMTSGQNCIWVLVGTRPVYGHETRSSTAPPAPQLYLEFDHGSWERE